MGKNRNRGDHMSAKPLSSKVREIAFGVLSFILSLLFVLLSFGVVLESTVLNKSAWIDSMNRCDYFRDKTEEIKKKLTDLTYATGLEETFFDNFVEETLVTEDTNEYIGNYFDGKSTVVDTTSFNQKMTAALERYMQEKQVKNADSKQLDVLIKEAERIYKNNVSIVALGSVSAYFQTSKKMFPLILGIMLAVALGLIAVLFFASKRKHRAIKYCYYACAGAFLSNLAAAVFILVSAGTRNMNFDSRSLYNFIVCLIDDINIILWICAVLFLLISAVLIFAYRHIFIRTAVDGTEENFC